MSLLSVCSTYYRTSYICTTTNSLSFKKSHFGRSTELQIPQICKKNLVKYFGQIISLKKLTRNYTMFKKMSKNTNTGIIQTRDSNHTNLKLHFFPSILEHYESQNWSNFVIWHCCLMMILRFLKEIQIIIFSVLYNWMPTYPFLKIRRYFLIEVKIGKSCRWDFYF